MIEGFVEHVSPNQILGWAYDRDHPSEHLVVDIYCGERHLGSTSANIYRLHRPVQCGFMFLFAPALEQSELATVVARTRSESDPTGIRELPRYIPPEPFSMAQVPPNVDATSFRDDAQFPVFVLGGPRSGTSAIAQSLIIATSYKGYNEGHILDLLFPLLDALRRFYEKKAQIPIADRTTMMISKLPEERFIEAISVIFADAVRRLFPSRHWCDKTPTQDMICSAPTVVQIWPNAKFIFLKRRALENLLSRMRKFSHVPFERQCTEWTSYMDAWQSVRGALAGRALELDQHFLARHPDRSAEAISRLLALGPDEATKLASVLGGHQPERTSANLLDVADTKALNWDAERWAVFDRFCGRAMAAYGYSRDQSYYAPSAEDRACLAL